MRITSLILLFLLSSPAFGTSAAEVDDLHKSIYPLFETHQDSAMSLAIRTLKMSEDLGYDWGIANSYYIQGYLFQVQNELSPALLMYLKSANILKHKSDDRSIINYLQIQMNCGTILRWHSKYEEALDFYNNALELAEIEDMKLEKLRIIYNKSFAFREMKNFGESLATLDEARQLAISLGDNGRLVNCWMAMGSIHQEAGSYEEAKYYFGKILDSGIAEDNNISGAWKNLGEVFEKKQNYDSAEFCYLMGLKIINDLPVGSEKNKRLFEAKLSLSGLYLKTGEFDKGIAHGSDAINDYNRVDLSPGHYKIFKVLSDLNYKKGRSNQSYENMSRYYEENAKFQAHQEEVIRLRDKFKIDILLAGFYGQVERETVTSRYQMVIGFLLIGIVLWIGISRIKFNMFRSQLAKEIRRINHDSIV